MRLLSRKAYLVLLAGDLLVLYLSLYLALSVRHLQFVSFDTFSLHVWPFTFLFLGLFVIYFLAGLYGRYTLLFINELPKTITISQTVGVAFAIFLFFVFPLGITPKWILLWFFVFSSILLFLWRLFIFPKIKIRREVGAVLLGTSIELSELAEEVNKDPIYPLEFRAIIHPELVEEKKLLSLIEELVDDGVSVVVADVGNRSLDNILPKLYDLCFVQQKARFLDARTLYEEVFEKVPISLIDERWILRNIPMYEHTLYTIGKRIIDIFAGLILAVVFVVIFPVVAVLLKLQDGGDIFYVSPRVGKGGKKIYILKFRTMTGKDDSKGALKSKHKVTKVGKFLRRFRIDEIPQFFNLLQGDISLVGPRPEIPSLVKVYENEIPFYNLRHMIKPGLTGWAQVKHKNHPHHCVNTDATREKLSYDLLYIKKRDLILDFLIILKTVNIVLKDTRA